MKPNTWSCFYDFPKISVFAIDFINYSNIFQLTQLAQYKTNIYINMIINNNKNATMKCYKALVNYNGPIKGRYLIKLTIN